jgi:hypothetical protein
MYFDLVNQSPSLSSCAALQLQYFSFFPLSFSNTTTIFSAPEVDLNLLSEFFVILLNVT